MLLSFLKSSKSNEKYPWHLLVRTFVLLNAFLVYGISDSIVGPTLLDLKDVFESSLATLSFMMLLRSLGSLLGSFLTGLIFDKLKKFQYLILTGAMILMAIPTICLPHLPNVFIAYVFFFAKGMGEGALNTGENVLILDIWKGRESGPYMHALHFTFGIGTFLAPVLARPFLFNAEPVDSHSLNINSPELNKTNETEVYSWDITENPWTIKTLYPIIGIYSIISSFALLFYFIKDYRKVSENNDKSKEESNKETPLSTTSEEKSPYTKYFIVTIMSIMIFFSIGMEVAFGTYISVFAVESDLHFTRPQGADVTAIFWGTFAATRGVAILLAIVAKPNLVIWSSYSSCLVGTLLLTFLANTSSTCLYLGTALMGLGIASIYATGFLWMEQRIKITSQISSALVMSTGLGALTFPLLVGQLVETWPMTLHYLSLSIVAGCILLFGIANIIFKMSKKKPVIIPENAKDSEKMP